VIMSPNRIIGRVGSSVAPGDLTARWEFSKATCQAWKFAPHASSCLIALVCNYI